MGFLDFLYFLHLHPLLGKRNIIIGVSDVKVYLPVFKVDIEQMRVALASGRSNITNGSRKRPFWINDRCSHALSRNRKRSAGGFLALG